MKNDLDIKFDKLPIMEKLKWEMKIRELFYDERTKIGINLFDLKTTTYTELKTGKETTFSGFMKGTKDLTLEEMGKLPVLTFPRTNFNRPADEEFEKLFQAKLESCQWGNKKFIEIEKKEIANFPDYITKEFKTICAWDEFLNKKLKEDNQVFDTNDTTNPLIFDKILLQLFSKFDGLLWDTLDLNWFRQTPKKIKLKKGCTQRMFIYFFDKFLDKELCKNPTGWLRLLFTKAFNYTNQRKEIINLMNPINKRDKKSISFNTFKEKIDGLISEIEKNCVS